MKHQNLIHVLIGIVCIGCLPRVQAVVPVPDGGYPGGNTAEGQNALFSLTTGGYNTAVGFFSLRSDTSGSFNTGVGAGTLLANTGDENTATGVTALFLNSTGSFNTADGALALLGNTEGSGNTANGDSALFSNTTGDNNTAIGFAALYSNTGASSFNTAVGLGALTNNTSGSYNTALGVQAGLNVHTASNVICIGASVPGEDMSDSCYIGNIFGQTAFEASAVFVSSSGKLGTSSSSRRFKEDIKAMDQDSETLLALKPVSFRYKKEIDPAQTPQFGLVAEDVEKVNPDLIVRGKDRKPYSVRYDQVNAMLLNEFLKEHKKVEHQQATIAELKSTVTQQQESFAEQRAQIQALAAGLQKVSALIEVSKSTPTVVVNTP